jgi:hypothetical protein
MSTPNENDSPKFSSESIDIDETGKVLINDPVLAKMNEELSQEDLDSVAGGLVDGGDHCYNESC